MHKSIYKKFVQLKLVTSNEALLVDDDSINIYDFSVFGSATYKSIDYSTTKKEDLDFM